MDMIVLMIGMLLSFIAGAYVRKPFSITKDKPQPAMINVADDPADPLMKEIMNAWQYTGKPQITPFTNKGGDFDE